MVTVPEEVAATEIIVPARVCPSAAAVFRRTKAGANTTRGMVIIASPVIPYEADGKTDC
jgi:hypothetical protein